MKLSTSLLGGFAVLSTLLSCPVLAQTDAAFFDNTVVHEIRLTTDPAAWQTLRDNYAQDDYYSSDFTWNGTTLKNVGIRSRGSGSRSPKKPNLLVKFAKNVKGQKFLGHSAIVLKANNQDGSLMREFLTFGVLGKLGLSAPREAFTRLYVNNEFWGLYTIVEDPDEEFLARAYGESTGYLFEFNPVLGYDFSYQGEDVDTYVPLYDPKTNDKAPQYEKLIAMIRTVNQASDADFQASAGAYVDLDGLMALLAAQNYMGDEDGVLSDVFTMNNFYLYRAANGQQFRFIPWDEDFSMIWSGRLVEQNLDKTVISRRAYAVPALRQTYLDSLMQTSTVAGAEDGWLQQEIERVYALIAPDARLDPHKQCIRGGSLTDCDADDFELQVDEVRKFAADRYNNVRSQLLAIPNHSATLMADGGIVNAATSKDGLAPGSLASIYGSSMAGTGEPASTFPLPTILSNTQVLVNGVAAPLLFASPLQINFQVPWATQAGDALIELSVAGAKKDAQRVPVQATAPGIFAATHANFVGVNGANPAKAGETLVLFATGLGPVSLSVADGQPAPLDQLSFTRQTVTATVDGLEAAVAFAGLAPGTAGVYQVNVVLPDSLNQNSASMANIALHVGGTDSPDFAVPKQ